MIDEGDANCGLHGARFELEGNENKSEDWRKHRRGSQRRLRQGIRIFETDTLHDELENGDTYMRCT